MINKYDSFKVKALLTTISIPQWLSGKGSTSNEKNSGLIPESGRSPREGNDNLLQYSCLQNPMDRGTWWATVHGVANELHMTSQLNNKAQFSSVAQSCPTLCHLMNHSIARLSCLSPTPGGYLDSCPLSQWCYPTIPSSVVPFSFCLPSFPGSGSFLMSQLFASDSQSIGVSASKSVLPVNTQDWSALGWTGWISWQSKGLSRIFSNTTVQKHQFFGTQLSL